MNLKQIFIPAIILLALNLNIHSQFLKPKNGGGIYLNLEGKHNNSSVLNSISTGYGYTGLSKFQYSYGIGLHANAYGLIAIFEANWSTDNSAEAKSGAKINSYSNGMFLNFGYSIVSTPTLDVYPMIGIGLKNNKLSFENPGHSDNTSTNFENIISFPNDGTLIKNTQVVLNFALGTDNIFDHSKRSNKIGFSLGIRLGYHFAIISNKWKTGDNEITGGPESMSNGAYLKIALGCSAINYIFKN